MLDAPDSFSTQLDDDHRWVRAEPFRHQLFHLAAATNLSPPVLAVVTKVPWRTVRRLMTGRPGKIRIKDARRLLAVRPDQIRSMMAAPAEPSAVRDEFVRLARRGASTAQIAAEARVSLSSVRACLRGEPADLTWLVLWRARAALLTHAASYAGSSDRTPVDDHVLLAA